jgi:fibronectin type 3 domain-containing protein
MHLDKAASTNDIVAGMTSVTFGGSLTVTSLSGTLAAGDQFQLFSASSYTGSFASMTLPALSAGLAWNFDASSGSLSVVTVQAPAIPTGLAATPGTLAVALNWNASANATTYNVKRATSSGGSYTVIASPTATSFTDTNAAYGTTYYYVVSASNGAAESENSAEINATPLPPTPSTPGSLSALPGNAQVTLSWLSSTYATNYNVKRAIVSGGAYSTVASVTSTNYSDTTAGNGTKYYYVVSASNAVGESSNSTEVAVTPSDMAAWWKFDETSGTTAADSSVNGNNITLQSGAGWAVGIINNALSLTGTGTSYANAPTGLVTRLDDFTVSTWVYVNTNATWARVFDFGSGTGTYMFLTPASGSSTVRYAITTNSSGGEQKIDSVSVLSPGAWHHVAVTLAGTTGTLYIDGAVAGANSSMTIRPSSLGKTSQNYIGKSQWVDPYLNGKVDDFRIYRRALSVAEIGVLAAPGAPAGLNASSGNNQVALSWTGSLGATSYNVKRSTTSGGPYSPIANPTATSYTDTTAVNGTTYYYVVSALNGSAESANSGEVSGTPLAPVPSPWVTADVGAVGAAGSASYNSGTFTVTGSGADIGGTADEFRYVYQPSSGNCEMRGRVVTVQNTDPSAKAGVMIRESTAAGARYAAVLITPGNSVIFQRRTTTGGTTATTTITGIAVPQYVRIVRGGNGSFTAYYSANGTSWTQIGTAQSITMASSATIGLAVSSHVDGTLCTSTLDNVTATP